ncbi:MAG: hypothetical protein WC250_03235 [Candidatus Paceibacterota bacterium]|jgi:hypothetical protein
MLEKLEQSPAVQAFKVFEGISSEARVHADDKLNVMDVATNLKTTLYGSNFEKIQGHPDVALYLAVKENLKINDKLQ